MAPAIEVRDLTKSYGDHAAVRDITFSVEEGEVFCLLGPNGAGKTTTTEILEGYRDRTSGHVAVLGFDPGHHERAFRGRVGIVLQECGSYDDLTVAEAMDMYRRWSPRSLDPADVVSLVELDAKANDRVGHLSGGQRRRLDLGLALIGDPDLVFLDEPTTGFDPAARRHSWTMVRNLCRLGKTVLLTTHFMDEAQALADRIAVVAGGRIVAEGTPQDLGGRDAAPTRIDFTLPEGTGASDLPHLAGAEVSLRGNRVQVVAADGVTATHRVTQWALESGRDLPDLAVARPTLEDVYLQLTNDTSTDATTTDTVEGAVTR